MKNVKKEWNLCGQKLSSPTGAEKVVSRWGVSQRESPTSAEKRTAGGASAKSSPTLR